MLGCYALRVRRWRRRSTRGDTAFFEWTLSPHLIHSLAALVLVLNRSKRPDDLPVRDHLTRPRSWPLAINSPIQKKKEVETKGKARKCRILLATKRTAVLRASLLSAKRLLWALPHHWLKKSEHATPRQWRCCHVKVLTHSPNDFLTHSPNHLLKRLIIWQRILYSRL